MNILYACDNNYVWLMGISTISLFENNTDIDNLHVYLLGESISDDNKKLLNSIGETYNRVITVIDIPQLDIPASLVSARWPLSAFTRLYAGVLLPSELDKVLYLDCDTIIKGSIKKLENWEVSNKIFFGIKDCIGKEYKINIGLEPDGIYVNAGVLLTNLDELRKVPIKDRLNEYMSKYEKLINYADQDVLNGIFHGSIGVLPPCYDVMTIVSIYSYEDIQTLRRPTNYYSEQEMRNALAEPVIIHYTTNMRTVRPWFTNTNHPLAAEFRRYMNMSPWKTRKLSKMHFTSRESKIIGIIEQLPNSISMSILGFLHSSLKPRLVRLRAR